MSTPLLTVSEIHTYYGDSYVLQGVSFTLRKGQIAAILGRNGKDNADPLGGRAYAPAER